MCVPGKAGLLYSVSINEAAHNPKHVFAWHHMVYYIMDEYGCICT